MRATVLFNLKGERRLVLAPESTEERAFLGDVAGFYAIVREYRVHDDGSKLLSSISFGPEHKDEDE